MVEDHESGTEHAYMTYGPQRNHHKADLSQLCESGSHGPPASLDEPSSTCVAKAQDNPCS